MTPGRPLAGLTPAPGVLGVARVLMLLQSSVDTRAPWTGPVAALPGEEDARQLAAALTRWWAAEPDSAFARVVVGVDPAASPVRWSRAPSLDGGVVAVAPEDAFPGTASPLRARLSALTRIAVSSRLILVASAEPPGVLGRRLRAIATDPASSGKIVAVATLGGPLRPDLPASLLAEGRLSALGVFEAGPVGRPSAIDEIVRWALTASGEVAKGRRVEEIAGPLTWYY